MPHSHIWLVFMLRLKLFNTHGVDSITCYGPEWVHFRAPQVGIRGPEMNLITSLGKHGYSTPCTFQVDIGCKGNMVEAAVVGKPKRLIYIDLPY